MTQRPICLVSLAKVGRKQSPTRAPLYRVFTDGAEIVSPTVFAVGVDVSFSVEGHEMAPLIAVVKADRGTTQEGRWLELKLKHGSWPYKVFASLMTTLAEPTNEPKQDRRPDPQPSTVDYLKELGLTFPFTESQVRKAFDERVWKVHPDRGGSVEAFHLLRTAYQEALAFLKARR